MQGFNKVLFMGRLTKDPDTRETSEGLAICSITLASSRKFIWKNENREETTFVNCTAFGKTAESIKRYLKKGDPLFVEGRLKLNKWETENGEKRSKLEINIEKFYFLNFNYTKKTQNTIKDNNLSSNIDFNSENNDHDLKNDNDHDDDMLF